MSTLFIHGEIVGAERNEYRYRGDTAKAKRLDAKSGQRACDFFNANPLSVNLRNGACFGTNFKLVEVAANQYVIGFEVLDSCLAEAVRSTEPWEE